MQKESWIDNAETIDLSSWNYPADFGHMASKGITEVVLRATIRANGTDGRFHEYMRAGPQRYMRRVGAYHLWDSRHAPWRQAENFLNCVSSYEIDWCCLDVEEDVLRDELDMQNMYTFLLLVKAELGRVPWIYTSIGMWNDWHNSGAVEWASDYPLWVADYDAWRTEPRVPSDWDKQGAGWSMWQYCGNGNAMGEFYGVGSASVDLNVGRKRWGLLLGKQPIA